jgi:nitroreductase
MNVSDALKSRFTCRSFKQDPVSWEKIKQILEDALHSPSWANTQPWEIYVANGDKLKQIKAEYLEYFHQNKPRNPDVALAKTWPDKYQKRKEALANEMFNSLKISDAKKRNASWRKNFEFFGAPAVIYLCMDKNLGEWSMFDMGALSQSIMLAAVEAGLDSAPAINLVVYPEILRKELNIPEELSIVFGIALGYKDDESPQSSFRSSRLPLNEVVKYFQ